MSLASKKTWKPLTGPPLTPEQNKQCQAIFSAIQGKTISRAEGLMKLAKLADEWGMPLDEADLHAP